MTPTITPFGWADHSSSTPASAAKLEEFGAHIGDYVDVMSKAPVSDQVLYVSASGSDTTGDGRSPASAFKTIQKAHDSANAGWKISVGNGVPAQMTKITQDGLHITGAGLYPGDNRGTTLAPADDTGFIFWLEDADYTRIEYINLRNTSRAKWRGVCVYGKNCNHTRIVNCGISNNEAVCNSDGGALGGTAVMFSQGENNRVIETDFNGGHLALHCGRENAQTHILGGSVVGAFRLDVHDNLIYTIDEFADYATFGYLEGSSSALGVSAGELASLEAKASQTIKNVQMFNVIQENSVSQAKVKIGKGDGFSLTSKNDYIVTKLEGDQSPVNGGKIKLQTVTGIPAKGMMFVLTREVITYDGVNAETKEVENIQRKAMGSTVGASGEKITASAQTFTIPTGDALLFRYNQKAQQLQICKRVGGVTTVLAFTALVKAEGESLFLYAETEENGLLLKAYSGTGDDPVNVGDPHWAYGTPLATCSYTLTGADATQFGAGVFGYDGHRLDTENTAWRVDNYRLWNYAGAPAGGGSIKRQKATTGGPCIRRNGEKMSSSIGPTHRCEYHGWIHPKSGNMEWEQTDWDENATGAWYYLGGGDSEFRQCIFNGTTEVAGKFVTFSQGSMAIAKVTGERCGFVNGFETGVSWEDLNPTGYNYYDQPDWSVNGGIPEFGLMKTAITPGPGTETIPRTQRLPFFLRRTERWHGHYFHEGCTSEPVTIKSGEGNGYMMAIPVFGRATWPKVTFKVLAGGKGNLRVGIYALDPHSLLPMVHPEFPTAPPRLFDVGQKTATEEKQQVMALETAGAPTPLVSSVDWLGILIFARTGTEAKLAGLASQPGSPAPFGYEEAIDPPPPIFARYSVPDGGAPTFPVFHSLSTSGPIVRAYRSV